MNMMAVLAESAMTAQPSLINLREAADRNTDRNTCGKSLRLRGTREYEAW